MKKMILFTMLMSLNVAQAQSKLQNPINWGAPAYGGTGCQFDALNPVVDFSKQQNRLSIQFNEFRLQMDGTRRLDRKNCSIRIPVQIQAGFKIVLSNLEANSEILENRNNFVKSEIEIGIVGQKGLQIISQDPPGKIGPLNYSKKGKVENSVISPCGGEVMLEVNSSIAALSSLNDPNSILDATVKQLNMKLGALKCK